MKHKLNCTVEGWQQVDNYINFFHSQNQKAKAGSMAFRSRTFDAMYLAAGSLHEIQQSRTFSLNFIRLLRVVITPSATSESTGR